MLCLTKAFAGFCVYFSKTMNSVVLLDRFLCCRMVSVDCAGEAGLVDELD